MTYEEWREINIPDWRRVPSSGWNDPNEAWHYEYRKQYPNWIELNKKPKVESPETSVTDKQIKDLITAIHNKPPPVFVDIPYEIVEAAEKIYLWFAERGIENWQVGHIQSRSKL